jgi:hypothetical protein
MNYFAYFPQLPYQFTSNDSSWSMTVTNFTAHTVIVEKVKEVISVIYPYIIEDNDRPDMVATKVYGGPEYTWIILVLNNIMSLYDWPLTETQFSQYIISKYGSQAAASSQSVYLTSDGYYVDAMTYRLLPPAQQGDVRSLWEDEVQKNEVKRTIRIVPAAFLPALTAELKQAFA